MEKRISDKELLDVYTDFLIVNQGQCSATVLSRIFNSEISHDQITRFLRDATLGSKELWLAVKPLIRAHGTPDGFLILDDTIQEKQWMGENELICYHHDHTKGHSVKGIQILTLFYTNNVLNVPVSYELITKPKIVFNEKKQQNQRKSEVSKPDLVKQMIRQALQNEVPFRYIMSDKWFVSADLLNFIHLDCQKDFIFPLKSNRNIALSQAQAKRKEFQSLAELNLAVGERRTIWLEDVRFPVMLIREVFANEDQSSADLYLITSDLSMTYQTLTSSYQKRWRIEEYHKSLKSNVNLAKSPARKVKTQSAHCFAAIAAFVKLEQIKLAVRANHFFIKATVCLHALKEGMKQLQNIKLAAQIKFAFA